MSDALTTLQFKRGAHWWRESLILVISFSSYFVTDNADWPEFYRPTPLQLQHHVELNDKLTILSLTQLWSSAQRAILISQTLKKKKQTFKGLGLLYTQMISESSEMTSDAAVF